MTEPKRIDVFGLKFSNTNQEDSLSQILKYDFSVPHYICFPSTNTVSKAYKNKCLQKIMNQAYLTIPDGKFTEIYARAKGFQKIRTTSGYWLMNDLLRSNLTHFFYGADNKTLELLVNEINRRYPSAKVLGYKSPPFLDMDEFKNNTIVAEDIKYINSLKVDLIWIGISTMKQDYLMYYHFKSLDHGLMLGVGAVFLYMAGTIKKGPEFIKRLGLRWIVRVIQEPRRLFISTLPSILFFLKLVLKEVFSTSKRK